MDENKEIITDDQNAEQAAEEQTSGTGDQEEKLFTQEEVNRLIKDRLKRVRAKAADEHDLDIKSREDALTKRESDLKARETALQCKEYLMKQGYPSDLMEILDSNDFETFRKKADKVMQLNGSRHRKVAPLGNTESLHDKPESAEAFSQNIKHKPKQLF